MANYTCNDYRQEMQLIAMKKQLETADLNETERQKLSSEIERLEAEMQID